VILFYRISGLISGLIQIFPFNEFIEITEKYYIEEFNFSVEINIKSFYRSLLFYGVL